VRNCNGGLETVCFLFLVEEFVADGEDHEPYSTENRNERGHHQAIRRGVAERDDIDDMTDG
jgi:hypothetical protein